MAMQRLQLLFLLSLLPVLGCGVQVRGAGATFPALLYEDWQQAVQRDHPNIRITYKALGSKAGQELFLNGKVDFAGSDVPLTDQQLRRSKRDVLQIPTTIGAVAPIYNVPDLKSTIRFTPEVLARIFAGKIGQWNHKDIKRDNPGIDLPPNKIIIVHRSDGSGTTRLISEFFAEADPFDWKDNVDFEVRWPRGSVGADGSAELTRLVQATPFSIGYVEYSYAAENNEGGLDWGYVQNDHGNFVRARMASVRAAATDLKTIPRSSLLETKRENAYPISALSWLLIPVPPDQRSRQQLCEFLDWMLDNGQKRAADIGYVELPQDMIEEERDRINRVCGGMTLRR